MMAGAVSEMRMASFLDGACRARTDRRGNHRSRARHARRHDHRRTPRPVRWTSAARAATAMAHSMSPPPRRSWSRAAAFLSPSTAIARCPHAPARPDVLEVLGVPINHDPAAARKYLLKPGFAFLFAPAYHPAMKHVGPVRRDLGFRTVFNLLGPICNPAGVRRQLDRHLFAEEWLEARRACAFRSRHRKGLGRARQRRPRRDDDHRRHAALRRWKTATSRCTESRRKTRA